MREVLATVREILPSEELKQFVDALGEYAEKVRTIVIAKSLDHRTPI